MGADIYLRSVHDMQIKTWEPMFGAAVDLRNAWIVKDKYPRLPETRAVKVSERKEQYRETLLRTLEATSDNWLKVNGRKLANRDHIQEIIDYCLDKMYERGYFHDSFNPSNLLWRLGIDYWHTVNTLIDEDGHMSLENIRALRKIVQENAINPISDAEIARTEFDDDGSVIARFPYTPEEREFYWRLWTEKRKKLLALLDEALALGEPLFCSCYWEMQTHD